MKYRIDARYVWYNEGTQIVLMYFIEGIPFTFDELPEIAQEDPEIIRMANEQLTMTPEIFYQKSF